MKKAKKGRGWTDQKRVAAFVKERFPVLVLTAKGHVPGMIRIVRL
jgi:hypothetical protein